MVKDFNYNSTIVGHTKLDLNYKVTLSPVYANPRFDGVTGNKIIKYRQVLLKVPLLTLCFINRHQLVSAYPYYPEWKDKMYCFQNHHTFDTLYKKLYDKEYPRVTKMTNDHTFVNLPWNQIRNFVRISINGAYDSCVTGKDTSLQDKDRLECPPVSDPLCFTTSYTKIFRHFVLSDFC